LKHKEESPLMSFSANFVFSFSPFLSCVTPFYLLIILLGYFQHGHEPILERFGEDFLGIALVQYRADADKRCDIQLAYFYYTEQRRDLQQW
jgi:hypothetical protein